MKMDRIHLIVENIIGSIQMAMQYTKVVDLFTNSTTIQEWV